jgi:hypothetical protein
MGLPYPLGPRRGRVTNFVAVPELLSVWVSRAARSAREEFSLRNDSIPVKTLSTCSGVMLLWSVIEVAVAQVCGSYGPELERGNLFQCLGALSSASLCNLGVR